MTKRALVVEGGGFRGAYAAGAVIQLLKEAPDLHFDVVVANSSSVCTAAYYITGQEEEMDAIWGTSDCLGSSKLMSWWRAPISFHKSFLNIDYLFDDVFEKQYPLNREALKKSKTEFFVTVMHYETGKRCTFSNRDPEIYDAMRASCAVPWAYIGQIWIRGERYIDGFYDSVPLRIAKEKGCDEIWVISTRPKGYRKSRVKLFENIPLQHFQLLSKRHVYYNETAEEIEADNDLIVIRPKETLPISRLTQDMDVFRQVIKMGGKDMSSQLASI